MSHFSRKQRRMSAESEDSTEDLISKSNGTPIRPSIDSTATDNAYMNYVVEVPDQSSTFRKWHKTINKSLVVVIVILALILIIFMALYFHDRNQMRSHPSARQEGANVCTTPSCVETAAYMQASMDKTIDPCNDFYLYSCAGWLSNNPLPSGEAFWDTVTVLSSKNDRKLKNILENTTVKNRRHVDSASEFNAYKLYRSCKNLNEIKRIGIEPLVTLMNDIKGFVQPGESSSYKHLNELLKTVYNRTMILPFFGISVGRDDKDSSKNIIKILQSGLGLSQYIYKESTNSSKKIIEEYVSYNVQLGMRIEKTWKKPEKFQEIMNEVFQFEKALQKIFVPRGKFTTIDQYYNKISIDELQKKFKSIEWKALLQSIFDVVSIKLDDKEPMLIYSLPYFEKLDALLIKTDLRVIHNMVVFKLLRHYSSSLTEDVIALRKNLTIAERGTYKKLDRWKRCVASTDSLVGMGSGALFAKQAFGKNSLAQASEMVKNLRNAFIQGFNSLTWMDKRTSEAAKEKAEAIMEKIGYPKFIMNPNELDKYYEGLNFSDKSYFDNVIKASSWYEKYHLKKLRLPIDKKSWSMTPPTVNAYYEPSENEIVFPAGILQPPYFKYDYPKTVNYGMMGAIIGHEITHAFDNNGRLYDKDGNYGQSWWSEEAANEFKNRLKCFVDEYSNFTETDKKIHIKGNMTLGENIADNGGLKAAYRAYQNSIKDNGEELRLPGVSLTNEQAFFVSFAQSWCTDELKNILIKSINEDSHSPAIERVRGSVQNNGDFARAFQCPLGSQMNPKIKCSIWS